MINLLWVDLRVSSAVLITCNSRNLLRTYWALQTLTSHVIRLISPKCSRKTSCSCLKNCHGLLLWSRRPVRWKGIWMSVSIFCCSFFLTFRWQGIIHLIGEKEDSLLTGKKSNALYEAVILFEDSGSQIPKIHKSDNLEKSRLCSSLLLYRLVDAISFARNYSSYGSILPRQIFPSLNITVSCLLQYSAFSNWSQSGLGWIPP